MQKPTGVNNPKFILNLLLISLTLFPSVAVTREVEIDEDDKLFASCLDNKLKEAAAAGLVGAAAVPAIGTLAGFGVAGIVKGSIAAYFQSMFGTGVVFSALQSLGASGALATVLGPVGLVGGLVAGGAYYAFSPSSEKCQDQDLVNKCLKRCNSVDLETEDRKSFNYSVCTWCNDLRKAYPEEK